MKRKLTALVVLCLLCVAVVAMTTAPAAAAHTQVIRSTCLEVFVDPPNVVWQKVVGDVAIIKMANHLRNYDAKDPAGNPVEFGNGECYTKGTWVANIVDGVPADSIMYGTFRVVGVDGSIWVGEWSGTMDMRTYAMDFVTWGRCVHGTHYLGMLLYSHGVNDGTGGPTVLTNTGVRLCWNHWMR